MRIPLITPLASRDGTVEKDERLVNCYGEQDDETKETRVIKRAGMTLGTAVITGPDAYPGQGMFNYGGYWFSMINDVFYYNNIWESIGSMVIWDSGDTYVADDEVLHEGQVYIAVDTSTNIEPGTDETKWLPAWSGDYPEYLYIWRENSGLPFGSGGCTAITKDGKVVVYNDLGEFWETSEGASYVENTSYTKFPTIAEQYSSNWYYFDEYGSGEWQYSTDLISWTNITSSVLPSGGTGAISYVVFDGKVWAFKRRGGLGSNKYDLYVSYTTDLINWTQYYKSEIQRYEPVAIVYNSAIYILGGSWVSANVIGGASGDIDVWKTTAGGKGATSSDWESVTSDWGLGTGLTAYAYGPIVWSGKIWINCSGNLSDESTVLYSTDAITWTQITPNPLAGSNSEAWPTYTRIVRGKTAILAGKVYFLDILRSYDSTYNVYRTSISG